jgi:molybdopterin-guanine dinucleotide biosynthesis protein A
MQFSGVVLAGGRSSRFGEDKARFCYQGRPLLTYVLASLQEAAERLIIAKAPYPEFEVPTVLDLYSVAAPLSGLCTALRVAQHDWVALAACDLPFLSADYWRALLTYAEGCDAVMVMRQGRLEPLAALYHRRVLALAEPQLDADPALYRLAQRIPSTVIPFDRLKLPERTLRNVNLKSDLM